MLVWEHDESPGNACKTHLLLLFVVLGDFKDRRHVVAKVELLEGGLDVLACYRLLRIFLGDLVGFRGDEGDELDTALDEEVARVFGKGHARLAGQDVLDNLLHRGCAVVSLALLYFWVALPRVQHTLGKRQVIVAAEFAIRHGG